MSSETVVKSPAPRRAARDKKKSSASLRSTARLVAGPIAGLIVIALLAGNVFPIYWEFTIGLGAVYAVMVLSLSLLAHWSGIWSIGHPALVAVGGYMTAYFSAKDLPLEVVGLMAIVTCALIGALLGFAGARFSVLYVALLTMAFTLTILEVIQAWSDVTNGDEGLVVNTLSSVVGDVVPSSDKAIYMIVVGLAVLLTLAEVVRRTAIRMRLVAAKTHPIVAKTIGIAPELQSTLGFALSGAVAGAAGVMLALLSGFLSPETFSMVLAINLIAATVLGGTGSIIGAVVGGAFLATAPTMADKLSIDQPYLVGGLLILALIFLPEGVVPAIAARVNKMLGREASDAELVVASQPAVVTAPEAGAQSTPAAGGTAVEVDQLGVQYGGLRAVDSITFNLNAGEVLGIIGPNGAGKTTFLNAMSGLVGDGRLNGRLMVGGRDVMSVRATRRRGVGIGRTFQHAELFDELTVIENLLAGKRWATRADRQEAERLLDMVGLTGQGDRLPSELPFGLQKRVDLARALSLSPRIVMLDEPFGGLDSDERATLANIIRALKADGVSVIIIDHVLEDLLAVTDRVVAMDFGVLIAEGEPSTVMSDPAVRNAYLGAIEDGEPPVVPADSKPVIELSGITHEYGGVKALRGVDISVPSGGVLGIVGANGAGKSTLGRILHGSLTPTHGTRTDAGLRISFVPEGRALLKTLSVRENLEVAAYAAGLSGAQMRKRIDEMAERLPERVRTRMDVSASSLSGGEQQLVAITRALVAEPDILILDEPALGLSPVMVQEVFREIRELADAGITTVLLDQSLNRALNACSQVIVLTQGEVTAVGNASVEGFAAEAEAAYFGADVEQ